MAPSTQAFRRSVWRHYRQNGRHDLPWRLDTSPYAVVVSEVMLQQTQVDRVVPKFTAWLERYPDWEALAAASLHTVLQQWQGLGYNRRARYLLLLAQAVTHNHAGHLPRDAHALRALPGIGPYTAAAIQAFAYNQPVTMIETNIRAVYLHHFFPAETAVSDTRLLPLITDTVSQRRPREWYWALMDYGSFLKTRGHNPSRRSKHHVRQAPFKGSLREVRGGILRQLTTGPMTSLTLQRALGFSGERIREAAAALESEGMIVRHNRKLQIAAE